MAISNKSRYEILTRDNFKCSLCGRTAVEDGVKLEVDHKMSVSKGGKDDISNLWTLCYECNRGKSADCLETNPYKAYAKLQEKVNQSVRNLADFMTALSPLVEKFEVAHSALSEIIKTDKTKQMEQLGRETALLIRLERLEEKVFGRAGYFDDEEDEEETGSF